MTNDQKADQIVEAILMDFTGRRGLRQEWEKIDEDIQEDSASPPSPIVKPHRKWLAGWPANCLRSRRCNA